MKPGGLTKVSILGTPPRIAVRDESEQHSVFVYGSPSVSGHSLVSADQLANLVHDPIPNVRSIDGEFVIIVETPNEVILANDRFAALPVFYAIENQGLVASFSYEALWQRAKKQGQLQLDHLAFFEFLHFQRLFGDTTFDQSTKALRPASLLSLNKSTGATEIIRYWKPSFSKRSDGLKGIARDLADAVRDSINRKTSDANSVSLLLSGGMDSRVVLGGFSEKNLPRCITIGSTENNEIEVAKSLASLVSTEHSFVKRSLMHYTDVLSESTSTGGGMFSFQHGHFFGLDIQNTDLILHGHGFDYFFQGMYLPSHRRHFMGRPTRSWSLDPIGTDLVGEYIRKAKYRLKGIDPSNLLKPRLVNEAKDRMRAALETVLNPIDGETSEPYDNWDYLTTNAPGRHYTYLNLLSAGSLAEQRTVAFDNDIFDIYYSTPANIRYGTQLLAETIRHLRPQLLEVRNANTNLRPDLSPARLTIEHWLRGAKRRLGVAGSLRSDPGVSDRSWPSESEIIRTSPALMSRVDQLPNAEGIGSLNIFDEAKIEILATELRNGNNQVASSLLSLITIDEFLSQST